MTWNTQRTPFESSKLERHRKPFIQATLGVQAFENRRDETEQSLHSLRSYIIMVYEPRANFHALNWLTRNPRVFRPIFIPSATSTPDSHLRFPAKTELSFNDFGYERHQ